MYTFKISTIKKDDQAYVVHFHLLFNINFERKTYNNGSLTIYFYKLWAYDVNFQVMFKIRYETKRNE